MQGGLRRKYWRSFQVTQRSNNARQAAPEGALRAIHAGRYSYRQATSLPHCLPCAGTARKARGQKQLNGGGLYGCTSSSMGQRGFTLTFNDADADWRKGA